MFCVSRNSFRHELLHTKIRNPNELTCPVRKLSAVSQIKIPETDGRLKTAVEEVETHRHTPRIKMK